MKKDCLQDRDSLFVILNYILIYCNFASASPIRLIASLS